MEAIERTELTDSGIKALLSLSRTETDLRVSISAVRKLLEYAVAQNETSILEALRREGSRTTQIALELMRLSYATEREALAGEIARHDAVVAVCWFVHSCRHDHPGHRSVISITEGREGF